MTQSLTVTMPSDVEIAMTRVFDAPRHLVFRALTTPELMQRWFLGPAGWDLAVCEADLRVGGEYRCVWRGKDAKAGKEIRMGGKYLEIDAPAKYVYTEAFEEPWYAGECVVITTLEEAAGRTTMTVTMRTDTKETRDIILKTGMEKGAAISYDRLAEVLATMA